MPKEKNGFKKKKKGKAANFQGFANLNPFAPERGFEGMVPPVGW
jgi:hypothetical protein